jgi:hypothetical protein
VSAMLMSACRLDRVHTGGPHRQRHFIFFKEEVTVYIALPSVVFRSWIAILSIQKRCVTAFVPSLDRE